jgi:hypothetical protein
VIFRVTQQYWDRFLAAIHFPVRWYCSYRKDKVDNPQTTKCSTAIGEHRPEKESDIDFRSSNFLNPLILTEHVLDAKHTCALKEMSVSISLYLVYGRRHNLREGARRQMPPTPQYFLYLRIFFGGGGEGY